LFCFESNAVNSPRAGRLDQHFSRLRRAYTALTYVVGNRVFAEYLAPCISADGGS
jgi:hypothetical protein